MYYGNKEGEEQTKHTNNPHDHSKSLILLKSSNFDQNAGKFLFVVNMQHYRKLFFFLIFRFKCVLLVEIKSLSIYN